MEDTESVNSAGIKDRLHAHSKSDTMIGKTVTPNAGKKGQTPTTGKIGEKPEDIVPETEKVTLELVWQAVQKLQQGKQASKEAEINSLLDSLGKRMDTTESLVSENELKIKILSNIIIRQEEQINNLKEQLWLERAAKRKPNLVVSGIIEHDNETPKETVQKVSQFFKDQMEIQEDIKVKKAQRLGDPNAKDRPVLIKLENAQEKAKIYKNITHLKGKQNTKRRLFYVNDDLDEQQMEQRRMYRALIKENNEQELNLTIKMQCNRLMVNNTIIKPKVYAPKSTDILRLTDEERMRVEAAKLVAAQEYTEKGSDYYAYALKVRNTTDVNHGYLKCRTRHGDATHISCAYHLQNPRGPFNQERINDEEWGVGHAILSAMKEKSVINMAVYVVRYFGGVKLGKRRFEILNLMTNAALYDYQYKMWVRSREEHLKRMCSTESLASLATTVSHLSELSYENAAKKDLDDDSQDDYTTPLDELAHEETNAVQQQD